MNFHVSNICDVCMNAVYIPTTRKPLMPSSGEIGVTKSDLLITSRFHREETSNRTVIYQPGAILMHKRWCQGILSYAITILLISCLSEIRSFRHACTHARTHACSQTHTHGRTHRRTDAHTDARMHAGTNACAQHLPVHTEESKGNTKGNNS